MLHAFTNRRCRALSAVAALCALVSLTADAKDLYVSPAGNDSVAYDSNNINTPWRTIDHGLYNLRAGDRLYIRAGTYAPRYPVWLNSDYNRQSKGGDPNEKLNAQSGTASAPVIVENYSGERVVVDLAGITTSPGVWINLDNKSYWTFRGLNFINSLMVFAVGEDSTSAHNTFENLNIQANRGGDNAAGIHLWGSRAEYTVIKGCTIRGPGQNVHLNTGTIYAKGVNNLKILGNTLSDAPIGIYYKHRNEATSASQVDIEIAYNYISNTSRASLEYNANFSKVHDNLFGANTAAAHFGDVNGAAGADYNTVEHNTFLAESLDFDSSIDSGDPFPGVVGNTVQNNIFRNQLEIMRFSSKANSNTIGVNLYPSSGSILTNSGTLALVAGSVIGVPTFTGGTTPTTVSGFKLTSTSLGVGKATDKGDLGGRIDIITQYLNGGGGGGAVPTPMSPSNLTVQ